MSADLRRRNFLKNAAAAGAALGFIASKPDFAAADTAQAAAETKFPQVQKLTEHIADFVVNLKFSDIPQEPLELGKKSILDALGLALSGSKAETWGLIQEYLKDFVSPPRGGAAVLGSAVWYPARFAAFANGVAIDVDDFAYTHLARAARTCSSPTMPESKWNARSRRRFRRVTMRMVFTPRGPAESSAELRPAPSSRAWMECARRAPSASPPATPPASAKTSAP